MVLCPSWTIVLYNNETDWLQQGTVEFPSNIHPSGGKIVQSSFGQVGLNKMTEDEVEGNTIANESATTLQLLKKEATISARFNFQLKHYESRLISISPGTAVLQANSKGIVLFQQSQQHLLTKIQAFLSGSLDKIGSAKASLVATPDVEDFQGSQCKGNDRQALQIVFSCTISPRVVRFVASPDLGGDMQARWEPVDRA